MAYEIKNESISKPLEWLVDDVWSWLADYTDSEEYAELDDMYRVLVGDWTVKKYKEISKDNTASIKKIKTEYSKRFPLLLADAFSNIAEDIKKGELIINQTY